MGNGRKIMFLNYVSIWENRYPQTFKCPILGLFTWIAMDFKSEYDTVKFRLCFGLFQY